MTKEEAEYVLVTIDQEGLDNCFNSYSRFADVEDEDFHKLRQAYLNAQEQLQSYLDEAAEVEEDE